MPVTHSDSAVESRAVLSRHDGPSPDAEHLPGEMAGGAAILRAAGLQVDGGLLAAEARELNVGFFSRHERHTPWVRLKLGASLDGRTALASGESRWITGPQARADGQLYRARSSVVLTGAGIKNPPPPLADPVHLDGDDAQVLAKVRRALGL